jgi:hypothetical protein
VAIEGGEQMNGRRTIVVVIVAGTIGAVIATAALSRSGRTVGPPAVRDRSVPRLEEDRGVSERLLLVVGGTFVTREEAVAANAEVSFGGLQGFYVAETDQFVGLREVLGETGNDYVLVSAFRTSQGAREFLDLAEVVGAPAFLTPRLENLGWEYVGLGQEPDPDGSGPLTEPIPGLTT